MHQMPCLHVPNAVPPMFQMPCPMFQMPCLWITAKGHASNAVPCFGCRASMPQMPCSALHSCLMTASLKNKQLSRALDRLSEKVRASPKKSLIPVPQMSLELWPEAVRGVPNAVLRGALFTVSQRRAWWKKKAVVSTVGGVKTTFQGERFNQTDLDVWEMLVHLARTQPLGDQVYFTAHAMLKALGRSTGNTQHQQLHEEFVRLRLGTVEMTWPDGKSFAAGLVQSVARDEPTGRYVVKLDRKILQMYADGYSQVDWNQRQALGTNNLAKWLHGFYSSHAKPYPYKVETIRNLCGSTVKELFLFRRNLKRALNELVEIEAIAGWEIDQGDLLTVSKIPTASQKRHLLNRRT